MRPIATILLLACMWGQAISQDSTSFKAQWSLNGYLKSMQTLRFDKYFSECISGNLLHNRLNLKFKPAEKWIIAAEARNRIFWGEEIKMDPDYAQRLRNRSERWNLSVTWVDRPGFLVHSNTERLWVEYREKKWNLRAGRQRINWGMATTWNPNDIFNSYNFLDFDYEERPGSDAAKLQYQVSDFSSAELAVAMVGEQDQIIGALHYLFHTGNYDIQLVGGWFRDRITLGSGWAGSISDAGFRGEIQYFVPVSDSGSRIALTVESDYAFRNGWYVNAGILFNSAGLHRPVSDWTEVDLDLSPENLMPTKWNFLAGASKDLTALFNGRFTAVYSPGVNMLILFPALQYNLVTNLDASFNWQSYFAQSGGRFQAVTHMAFIRIRWSF